MLRTPMLCTSLLVRNENTLDQAFQQEASYIFHDKEQHGIDFIHRTIECTKPGIGLRFFMVLAALGEQGLANYVERQFDLTTEVFVRMITNLPDYIDQGRPILAWLYTIARNLVIDHYRNSNNRHSMPLEESLIAGEGGHPAKETENLLAQEPVGWDRS